MVRMVPVDRQRHSGKGWRPVAGYGFAAHQSLLPLNAIEFGMAAVAMPIAFIENGGKYIPVAVTSPVEGRNLFVSPQGQWLGRYLPGALRSYPFRLGNNEGGQGGTLLFDEDSGWLIDADERVPRFFEDDGSPSTALKNVVQLLQELEHGWTLTDMAIAALAEAEVILPWSLTMAVGDQRVNVSGLHRIDEAALGALDEKAFVKLRQTSSLAVAHAQMISMHNIDLLSSLGAMQQKMMEPANPSQNVLEPFTLNKGETVKF